MFSGNNVVPWHKLGTVVSGLLTAKEAIEAAHLGWKVDFAPIYVNGVQVDQNDWQATIRTDTNGVLGIVKSRYEVIQNSECFSFMDSLVADGNLKYETAGALRGGKQVWIMAKYNGEISINSDQHKMWLLLVTSHDGSKCLECAWVTERVVCANTLSIALKGKSNSIKIRHSSTWEDKRNEAQRVLGLTKTYFGDLQSELAKLQDRPFTQDDMEAFSKLLYPASKGEKDVATRTSNMRWGTARLFNRGAGNHGQTAWDALNAVTDYVDHQSTIRGQSTRLESALMGSGAQLKQKAFDLLTSEDLMNQLMSVRDFKPAIQPVSSDEFSRLLNR